MWNPYIYNPNMVSLHFQGNFSTASHPDPNTTQMSLYGELFQHLSIHVKPCLGLELVLGRDDLLSLPEVPSGTNVG